jgi:hypothetical protein
VKRDGYPSSFFKSIWGIELIKIRYLGFVIILSLVVSFGCSYRKNVITKATNEWHGSDIWDDYDLYYDKHRHREISRDEQRNVVGTYAELQHSREWRRPGHECGRHIR